MTLTAAREITFPLTVMLLLITYQVLLKGVVVHFHRNIVLKKEQIDQDQPCASLFVTNNQLVPRTFFRRPAHWM